MNNKDEGALIKMFLSKISKLSVRKKSKLYNSVVSFIVLIFTLGLIRNSLYFFLNDNYDLSILMTHIILAVLVIFVCVPFLIVQKKIYNLIDGYNNSVNKIRGERMSKYNVAVSSVQPVYDFNNEMSAYYAEKNLVNVIIDGIALEALGELSMDITNNIKIVNPTIILGNKKALPIIITKLEEVGDTGLSNILNDMSEVLLGTGRVIKIIVVHKPE